MNIKIEFNQKEIDLLEQVLNEALFREGFLNKEKEQKILDIMEKLDILYID